MSQEELFRIQYEERRMCTVLKPVAKKLLKFISGHTEESLVKTMIDMAYMTSRDFEPAIEDGSVASAQLGNVAEQAEKLREALAGLGPGGRMVLHQSTVLDSVKSDADVDELPLADDAPLESSLEELLMWQRGGKWIVRLGALSELARHESARVHAMIHRGGPKVFQRSLADTEQRQIIRACIKFVRKWGAPERLALVMARAIHEAHTGEKVEPRWGSSVLPKLL